MLKLGNVSVVRSQSHLHIPVRSVCYEAVVIQRSHGLPSIASTQCASPQTKIIIDHNPTEKLVPIHIEGLYLCEKGRNSSDFDTYKVGCLIKSNESLVADDPLRHEVGRPG